MIRLLFALLLLRLAGPAWAISDPAEMMKDPALEARAEQVGRQLRCLVCQNESIEDSNADLARDLRALVRQRIAAGDTDRQATEWVVARYGDFVRLRPPMTLMTAALWLSPVIAVGGGLGAALLLRRRAASPPAPLSEAERARLARADGLTAGRMIFVLIALLALAVLAPVLVVLRGRAAARGAREPAIALHQTQLRELDRDLAEGRILPAEHATAVLEVQRRLLAAAAKEEAAPRASGRWVLAATALFVPLLAFGLYAVSGSKPFMPSVNGAQVQAQRRGADRAVAGSGWR